MIILKILIGVAIYFAILTLFCIFLKGATQLGNAYDEKIEIEELMKAKAQRERNK